MSSTVDGALSYESLGDTVAQWLTQEIILGRLGPGTRLLETEIAKRLKVSRSPVREALRQLEVEGLVEILPRRETRVAAFDAESGSDFYDCRLILEPLCYSLAARSASDEQIDELGAIIEDMKRALRANDQEAYQELDIAYHRRLAHLCPNTVLVELFDILWRRSLRYRHVVLRLPDRPKTSLRYHMRVQEAVRKRDHRRVEETTRELLLDSKQVLLRSLAAQGAQLPAESARAVLEGVSQV